MDDLSEAVVHWIAYQKCIGIDRFLTESALTIPIVGYLRSQGWETQKETDYGKICKSILSGKCYADYWFVKGDDNLILETKFFKSSSDGKIFNDIVRLALPSNSNALRCVLLTWSKAKPAWAHFGLLLNLKCGDLLNLNLHSRSLLIEGREFDLSYNAKKFEEIRSYGKNLDSVQAKCIQKSESNGYGAMLLLVSRTEIVEHA